MLRRCLAFEASTGFFITIAIFLEQRCVNFRFNPSPARARRGT
jgi:hypothetical protein